MEADLIAITGTNGKTTTTALTGELAAGTGAAAPRRRQYRHAALRARARLPRRRARRSRSLLVPARHDRAPAAARGGGAQRHARPPGSPQDVRALRPGQGEDLRQPDARRLRGAERRRPGRRLASRREPARAFSGSAGSPRWITASSCGTAGSSPSSTATSRRSARSREIPLRGQHNVENVLAATACALWTGLSPESIRRGIGAFRGVAHRIERVLEERGVAYYNDSKGTNVASTIKALESFTEPVILIAGGKGKGQDFGPLAAGRPRPRDARPC